MMPSLSGTGDAGAAAGEDEDAEASALVAGRVRRLAAAGQGGAGEQR